VIICQFDLRPAKPLFEENDGRNIFFISNKVGMYTKIYQDGFMQDFSKAIFFAHFLLEK